MTDYRPAYLDPPKIQDLSWDMREEINKVHRVLNKERSYRQDGKNYDSHEIIIAAEDCARALWGKAREMREMIRETEVR